ncbi:MAG: hypothetical protein GXN91_04680 [Epsilonproteobacteria bacterium]|nr:hypothetical protein [Campylobacterota bacterium]
MLLVLPQAWGKNTPYSYSYIPKFVYKNQVFPVTILVKHYNPNSNLDFEFDIMGLFQPLNLTPVKMINKDNAFFTFYFQAKTNDNKIEIPSLSIWDFNSSYILDPKIIEVKELPNPKSNYSGVMASNFRINGIKISPYDSNNKLVILNIEAVEANLEDMHIKGVKEDGVENIKRDGANVRGSYFFVVDKEQDSIEFSYYNTLRKKFIDKKLSLVESKNRVQANLNPKDLSFDKFKKYSIIAITLFFLLFYIYSRDKLYLFVVIVGVAALIYFYKPKEKICINEGAALYILPTKNSNISFQIEEKIEREVLKEYNHYYKIEYKDNITGWIKDEDLCQN